MSDPSPLTIMSGASIDSSTSTRDSASIRCRICGVSRAFSTAVNARRGASSLELNSCAQVTGFLDSPRMIWRARSSCAGLRTEKFAATANASTRVSCRATAASMAASSSALHSSPVAEWPPWILTTAPAPRLPMPERSVMASSNPISKAHTGLKRFSTTALVASVVDTETRLTSPRPAVDGNSSSTARMALPIPIARFHGVVSALALAITRRPPASSTASVNVPPVSSPSQRPSIGPACIPLPLRYAPTLAQNRRHAENSQTRGGEHFARGGGARRGRVGPGRDSRFLAGGRTPRTCDRIAVPVAAVRGPGAGVASDVHRPAASGSLPREHSSRAGESRAPGGSRVGRTCRCVATMCSTRVRAAYRSR